MSDMEVDPNHVVNTVRESRERIVKRLARLGIADDYLSMEHPGIILFIQNSNWLPISDLVAAILPSDEEVREIFKESKKVANAIFRQHLSECMTWLKWIMFMDNPNSALLRLSSLCSSRGVCGTVWGNNEIAYRCKICEYDPTCAICIPCFKNGNHKNHDYSIIYTSKGCCDCGDVTAWKREGFCSKHKGVEQRIPLPEEYGSSVGPVVDALFCHWKDKLLSVEAQLKQKDWGVSQSAISADSPENILTLSVVEMILDLCKYSESMLSFISKRAASLVGLLEILVRAEWFLSERAVEKLQEMLFNFLGEPSFKYLFAAVFLNYYPFVVQQLVRNPIEGAMKKHPLLMNFSVQIFTVQPLTVQLVKERDLLSVLLKCLENIFSHCAGDNECILVSRLGNLYEICMRVVEDIRFVLCHTCVPKYVNSERKDIIMEWMNLIALVQGMSPLKRETGIHVEEVNEHMNMPFFLGHSIANIHGLLVDGAFNDNEDIDWSLPNVRSSLTEGDDSRLPKVGRLSQSVTSPCSSDDYSGSNCYRLLSLAEWLTSACLRSIERWLDPDGNLSSLLDQRAGSGATKSFLNINRTLTMITKGKHIFSGRSGRNEAQQGCSPLKIEKLHTCDTENKNDSMVVDYPMKMDTFSLLSLSYWPDIAFDVSLQNVSLHIPLHRLLALLLHKTLSKFTKPCNMNPPTDVTSSSSSSISIVTGFFEVIAKGCHPCGFSAFIMEHPLRNRVFISQVHAGMWRKNGDIAIISCELYRSVRWAEQGLELDLFLLQCCGAWASANDFVQRIGERFGLSDYLSLNSDCTDEYEFALVQEMLVLLMQILQERRYSGLTPSENLRRELIHKLAVADATRSQLEKSLPRDLAKLDQLQEILDSVAMYSNPSGFNQGMYSLRWTCWKELDLYYPRWNSKDLQSAEERYLRYTSSFAITTQLPRWKDIAAPLADLARISTCKMALQVVRAVCFYAVHSVNAARTPDALLLSALHFLSLSLDICSQLRDSGNNSAYKTDCNTLCEFAVEEITGTKYHLDREEFLISLLVSLLKKQKEFVESGSQDVCGLIEKLLKKMAELDSRCAIKLKGLAPELVVHLADLIDDREASSHPLSESERRAAKAKERQAAIMAKMKAEQSKFLSSMSVSDDSNADETDSDTEPPCDNGSQSICSLCHEEDSRSPLSFLVFLQKSRLASFSERIPPTWDQVLSTEINHCPKTKKLPESRLLSSLSDVGMPSSNISTNIEQSPMDVHVCHEQPGFDDSIEALEQKMFDTIQKELKSIFSSTIQKKSFSDNVVSLDAHKNCDLLTKKYFAFVVREWSETFSGLGRRHDDSIQMRSQSIGADGIFFSPNCDGVYLSSCGHAVHRQCLDRYLTSLRERHARRSAYEGEHIVNPDKGEFLCPVCRILANSVLPNNTRMRRTKPVLSHTAKSSIRVSENLEIDSSDLFSYGMAVLKFVSSFITKGDILKDIHLWRDKRRWPDLDYILRTVQSIYFPNSQDAPMELSRVNYSMSMWDVLKYSLASIEITSRCRKDDLQPIYTTTCLFQELNSPTGFALSMLLSNAQSMRSQNPVYVIQRFQGVLLFVDSLCFGVQNDKDWKPALKGIDGGAFDINFWDRAAAPILAYDAFSSLMWLLYCLPHPFMSCKESFLSLVHVFYFVTVVQATIIFCSNCPPNSIHSDYEDSLFFDIVDVLEKFVWIRKYFVSNHVDQPSGAMDLIRKLTFPFLRRCALLWKLVNSSVSEPFGSKEAALLFVDSGNELQEAEELERTFTIPDLIYFTKDTELRSLALRWLEHLYKSQFSHCVLHLNPCVPLKLMRLPYLYQDLLQRYIKQRCVDCKNVIKDPTLCLLCGKLCSPTWKVCCRENSLQSHTMICGAGTGVYLLLRKTTILLQRFSRLSSWPSLYLDSFGEEDVEMQRGKPLYLNEERYASLTYTVASHGIDRSSMVLGQLFFGLFT